MYGLDAGQMSRLLRDLELTAPVVALRAAPQIDLYLWLLSRLPSVDVRHDAAYQQRLSRFIGLRGKLRARKEELFNLLQSFKEADALAFEVMLREVSQLTGQVEKSVASSLLALIDPEQPAIDRDIREMLPRYGFIPLAEAPQFEECVAWHAALTALLRQVIEAPRWPAISARVEAGITPVPGAVLTELRKANLHLSHARRVVALMPTIEPTPRLPKRPIRSAAAGVDPTNPRPLGRLHLCR